LCVALSYAVKGAAETLPETKLSLVGKFKCSLNINNFIEQRLNNETWRKLHNKELHKCTFRQIKLQRSIEGG
jgi:hypothetical protein